jgi:hypothetical protein
MRVSLGDFAPAAAMYPIPQNSVTAAVDAGSLASAPVLGLSVSDVNSGPLALVDPGAGLGQAMTDVQGNTCAAGWTLDPGGSGLCIPGTNNETGITPYQCNWFESIFDPSACASAASPINPPPTLPVTGAYPVTITATPAAGSTTIQTITDSSGNVLYATTPSPQQVQASNVAAITAAAGAGYVDCTQLWNQLTNAACPCTYCSSYGSYLLIGLAAIAGFLILVKL